MSTVLDEEAITVAEAAKLLKVSPSTLWRWIDRGQLPAYRVGQRRVRIKKADLATHLIAARLPRKQGGATAQMEQQKPALHLSEQEQRQGWATLDRAKQLQQRLLAQRGGRRYPAATELLDQERDARSTDLG